MASGRDIPGHPGRRRPVHLETSADDTRSIAGVRRAATEQLQRAGVVNIADTVLVLSELVTNAVLHAGGAQRIVVDCDDGSISITVHDRSGRVPRSPDEPPTVGGQGLRIVERLASRWGSARCEIGKDVWAVLPAVEPTTRSADGNRSDA